MCIFILILTILISGVSFLGLDTASLFKECPFFEFFLVLTDERADGDCAEADPQELGWRLNTGKTSSNRYLSITELATMTAASPITQPILSRPVIGRLRPSCFLIG